MYQKIIIVGNLGRDPEMRYMADGTAVTNFNVATSRRWNDRNGQQTEETTWFRVSVWGRQAETANEYLSKGRQVLVEGRLRVDAATGGPATFTRNDGTVGASFEIIADTVRFIGGRQGGDFGDDESYGGGNSVPASSGSRGGGSRNAPQEEDDIPF